MNEVALKAEERLNSGKGVARKLRADGKIPATLYGRDRETVSLTLNAREAYKVLHGHANVLVGLEVGTNKYLALPREVQPHPIRNEILHVDFMEVSRDQRVTVDVSIHFEGNAPGAKEGGVVEHVMNSAHIECKAVEVPEYLSVDISGLELDDSLRVSDIVVPDGVVILHDENEVVATCTMPKLVTEAELETAEPTVEGEEPAEGAEAAEGEEKSAEAASE
ncbi:MAG: 50S ribosomal protein L25 [Actinomycetota bacterium]